ncbi:hypothetical protein B7494_g3989 [Chlorociboria aeruginascens]|nr:hypothetical protein B7494_g3989 [Chlorociboria aeruginascens]
MTAFGVDLNFDDAECLPSVATSWWTQATTGSTRFSLGPFICPYGYYAVFSTVVGPSSSMTGCCPSSYGYLDQDALGTPTECFSPASRGQTLKYASITDEGEYNTFTYTSLVLTESSWIYAINVNGFNTGSGVSSTGTDILSETINAIVSTSSSATSFASSSAVAPSSVSSSTNPSSTGSNAPSTEQTQNTSSKTGFDSTGARAGIAVGIAVFVLMIGYLLFYSLRHRRWSRKATLEVDSNEAKSKEPMMGAQEPEANELAGSALPHELADAAGGNLKPVYELGSDVSRVFNEFYSERLGTAFNIPLLSKVFTLTRYLIKNEGPVEHRVTSPERIIKQEFKSLHLPET